VSLGGLDSELAETRRRLREDPLFWVRQVAWIVSKEKRTVRVVPSGGQLLLDETLAAQRAAGRPQRAIMLKARQVGMTTWIMLLMLHWATQRENFSSSSLAHRAKTAANMYRMVRTAYGRLPAPEPGLDIKPSIGSYSTGEYIEFGGSSRDAWSQGTGWPNSRMAFGTASDVDSDRGTTLDALHITEAAFLDQLEAVLAAALNAVPDLPDTFVGFESTANGFNEFKDFWDDSVAGRNDFAAVFWPWWKQPEYSRKFIFEADREEFQVGQHVYGEDEQQLVDELGLTLEQLNWRRWAIANLAGGDLRTFHQEYPSTPEEAFLSTGSRVFDSYRISGLLRIISNTDPLKRTPENPGPTLGSFQATGTHPEVARVGTVDVPDAAMWVPQSEKPDRPPWKLWLPEDEIKANKPVGEFILFCDPSGGEEVGRGESDFHAINVIDHQTREQVAEWRSRCDADLLPMEILLAAMWFNQAWVGIERTGGWGYPALRALFYDYHYPYLYRARPVGKTNEKQKKELGFNTDVRTKPLMIAGAHALLRLEDFAGIKSRVLADEMNTYVKDENGKMGAEPGRFDDVLMSWMGAQQIASELPFRFSSERPVPSRQVSKGSGLGDYDLRLRR